MWGIVEISLDSLRQGEITGHCVLFKLLKSSFAIATVREGYHQQHTHSMHMHNLTVSLYSPFKFTIMHIMAANKGTETAKGCSHRNTNSISKVEQSNLHSIGWSSSKCSDSGWIESVLFGY